MWLVHRTRCWLRLLLQALAVPACRCRGIGAGALPGCACMAAVALPGPLRAVPPYSMPLRRIWLAAISITLMMKAMAKAQIRLLRTHVWRFCFWACTAGTRQCQTGLCDPLQQLRNAPGLLLEPSLSPLPAGRFPNNPLNLPGLPNQLISVLPNPSGTPLPHQGFSSL